MANSGDLSMDSSAYDLEFRSTADDAWYTVLVVPDDDTLTVKLWEFHETCDERFNVGDFETPESLDEFCQRFRPISEQVQDSQCSRIIAGMTVCASIASKDKEDLRFYDAVVEAVHYKEHSTEDCCCTFVLFWKHGPNKGNLTSANVADICLIQSGDKVDSRVASFSKLAKEKIKVASLKSSSLYEGDMSPCKLSSSQYGFQEMESAREFVGREG